MATRKRNPFSRKILATEPLDLDVEVHLSTLEVTGEVLIELREYIPSSKTYGRGILVPKDVFEKLLGATSYRSL